MQPNLLTVSRNDFQKLALGCSNTTKISIKNAKNQAKINKQRIICHYTRHLESGKREFSNVRRPIEQVPQTQTKAELAILYK